MVNGDVVYDQMDYGINDMGSWYQLLVASLITVVKHKLEDNLKIIYTQFPMSS